MMPAWQGAGTASRSHTGAMVAPTATRPPWSSSTGGAGNRTFWSQQLDVLTERYHVVAVDLGGHGESGTGRSDWNLPVCGDDVVVAVVDAVGAREVALVGHSMGGDASVFAARVAW